SGFMCSGRSALRCSSSGSWRSCSLCLSRSLMPTSFASVGVLFPDQLTVLIDLAHLVQRSLGRRLRFGEQIESTASSDLEDMQVLIGAPPLDGDNRLIGILCRDRRRQRLEVFEMFACHGFPLSLRLSPMDNSALVKGRRSSLNQPPGQEL